MGYYKNLEIEYGPEITRSVIDSFKKRIRIAREHRRKLNFPTKNSSPVDIGLFELAKAELEKEAGAETNGPVN